MPTQPTGAPARLAVATARRLTAPSPARWFTHLVKTLLAVLVAAALVLATVDGLARLLGSGPMPGSSWRPVGQLVGLSAVWLLANGPVEGKVLWSPTPAHGLTLADLLVVPPLLVAGLVLVLRLAR